MKKWVCGVIVVAPCLIVVANWYDLWWLRVITGSIVLLTALAVYVIAIKNNWQYRSPNDETL